MGKGHHRHLICAALLLGGAIFLFFVVRAFLIPKSFGLYGHFRGENLAEQASLPIVHGNPNSCAECHDDVWKIKLAGRHAAVPCQDCHAPLTQHVTEDGVQPMPIHKTFALCARCHQKLEAKPKTFPQIDFHEHVVSKDKNLENEEICLSCHQPHSPMGEK